MACVSDVHDCMFVVKLCKGEAIKMFVCHSVVCHNVDGRLAFTTTVGVRQKVPMGRTVLWGAERMFSHQVFSNSILVHIRFVYTHTFANTYHSDHHSTMDDLRNRKTVTLSVNSSSHKMYRSCVFFFQPTRR